MELTIPKSYFSLRKDLRHRKTDECMIYIQYCVRRRTIRFDTGLTCPVRYWSRSKNVCRSHPNHKEINARLRLIKAEYDAKLLANPPKEEWSIDVIRRIINPKSDKVVDARREDTDFSYMVLRIMENQYKTGRVGISVLENAKCNMNVFRKFLKHHLKRETIAPGEVTAELIDEYIVYRKEIRENDNFTINKALTPIFKAVEYAQASELISSKTALLITSKYLAAPKKDLACASPKDVVRYLTKEQMKDLLELYPTLYYNRTRDYIDMFLFSFHTFGLRFSDVMTLTWDNVDFRKKEINKVLVKGKVAHTIPLTDAAESILMRWKGREGCDKFCFGLLPTDFNLGDDAAVRKARINRNTSVRNSLHEVGRKLGLEHNLSFHWARHTFAVLSVSDGKLSLHAISKLMGHSSVLVTERVYAEYLPSKLKADVGRDMFGEFKVEVTEAKI